MSASAKKDLLPITKKLDGEALKEISGIVGQLTGVQLGVKQEAMVQSRLVRRMLELKIESSQEYVKYIKENFKSESQILISLLTTHHTFFFRDFFHFEYLLKSGLQRIIENLHQKGQKKIRIWSAACSHGQEAYSLAMFLNCHLRQLAPGMTYEIFGSDVDPDSVKIARNGVYRYDQIKEIPAVYAGQNWIRGSGEIADFVKAKGAIKSPCKFEVLNLFELEALKNQNFDIIFCRNVFIYFNQEQIKTITTNLLNHLEPHGLLFLGLSESLNGLKLPIKQLGPSVYEKEGVAPLTVIAKAEVPVAPPVAKTVSPVVSAVKKPAPVQEPVKPLRILCVDDSPVVLSILKKILNKEEGFQVVATASDGLEAQAMLAKHKVDLMTLDIHMPNQNGIEYLQKNFNATHPPVVMISSASREDAQFGIRSLDFGASDFIEKPTLANLQEKSSEIRMKIRCAVEFKKDTHIAANVSLEKSFAFNTKKIQTSDVLRVITGGVGDVLKIKNMLEYMQGDQPPLVLFISDAGHLLPHLPSQFRRPHKNVKLLEIPGAPLKTNEIYVTPMSALGEFSKFYFNKLKTHVLVLGIPAPKSALEIAKCEGIHILLEETQPLKMSPEYEELKVASSEIIPYTSMVYHSDRTLI